MKHFTAFCSLYNIPPWPASETTLRYYCVHAYRTISHATILVYLAAIRHYHLEHGYCDPLLDSHLLAYLCKGIRRHQGDQRRVRLPLTPALLADIRQALNQSGSVHTRDKPALWAAITLGFYGFLRGGEFTTCHSHTYSPTHHLLRRDIKIASDHTHYTVVIKSSKTDPYRCTTKITVAATNTNTCPVQAMRSFLRRTCHSYSQPLFTLSSGRYLTLAQLTATIRSLLQAAGLTPHQAAQYSSHSLRIGAATAAAAAGLPSWLIQTAGRWKSEAYRSYIRSPRKALLTVAPALSKPHN